MGAIGLFVLAAALSCTAPPAAPTTARPDGADPAPAPAAAPAAPRLPLRVATGLGAVAPVPSSLLWLAKDLGWYEREGLDVELIAQYSTPLALAALLSGQADIAILVTSAVIDMVATGKADIRAVHSPDASQHFLIAASSEVRDLEDLKGKVFGIGRRGSADNLQSTIVLRQFGVNPETDLQLVTLSDPANRATALVSGSVQATTLSVGTWQSVSRQADLHVLVEANTFHQLVPIVTRVTAAPVETIQSKPTELTRFTRAIVGASRHFAQNEQAWVEALMAYGTDLSRAQLTQLSQYYSQTWAVNGQMNLAEYERTARILYAGGALPEAPEISVDQWATTVFIDRALAEMGVYPGLDDPGRPIPTASR